MNQFAIGFCIGILFCLVILLAYILHWKRQSKEPLKNTADTPKFRGFHWSEDHQCVAEDWRTDTEILEDANKHLNKT